MDWQTENKTTVSMYKEEDRRLKEQFINGISDQTVGA